MNRTPPAKDRPACSKRNINPLGPVWRPFLKETQVDGGRKLSACVKAMLCGLGCLAAACPLARAQQSETVHAKTVPLVSDACPSVHIGDALTLDWNPGFDPAGLAANLRNFSLTFSGLQEDGITVKARPAFSLGDRAGKVAISSIGNGYFHIELPVSVRVAPGIYHLVDAHATPELFPEYQGRTLQMTNSPVGQRFCITVLGNPTAPSP
jgi:hypothetical protein